MAQAETKAQVGDVISFPFAPFTGALEVVNIDEQVATVVHRGYAVPVPHGTYEIVKKAEGDQPTLSQLVYQILQCRGVKYVSMSDGHTFNYFRSVEDTREDTRQWNGDGVVLWIKEGESK